MNKDTLKELVQTYGEKALYRFISIDEENNQIVMTCKLFTLDAASIDNSTPEKLSIFEKVVAHFSLSKEIYCILPVEDLQKNLLATVYISTDCLIGRKVLEVA